MRSERARAVRESLRERVERAKRGGRRVVVVVRAACPACGNARPRHYGAHGGVGYRLCRDCGCVFRTVSATADEIEALRGLDEPEQPEQ